MAAESCCTCATLLAQYSFEPPAYDFDYNDEKQRISKSRNQDSPRRLSCCKRAICADCIAKNPRFASYCPFCQISTAPTALPQGLRDPPTYSPPSSPRRQAVPNVIPPQHEDPPSYSFISSHSSSAESSRLQQEDITHHLHITDTLSSLSLAYNVPLPVLRQRNNIFSDNLLSARRTASIPASHYSGPSLSDRPVESEEETERKSKIRRFMVGAKCPVYEVAELYLGTADGDVEKAIVKWWEDERWEKENPIKNKGKGRVGKRGLDSGLTGQLR